MLSARSFCPGCFTTPLRARKLLDAMMSVPELWPEYWNTHEPIDNAFSFDNVDEVIATLSPPGNKPVRSLVFLQRKSEPAFLRTIDLKRGPGSGHNLMILEFDSPWVGREEILADYIVQNAFTNLPDYAFVANATVEDVRRFQELNRPYSAENMRQMLQGKLEMIKPPFFGERAKDGCLRYWFNPDHIQGRLMDVAWFNYFGRIYVDLIGKKRLTEAGWARVEEIGDGLACYSTERIDDPHSRAQRNRILGQLEEFFWTPGCKAEDKRVPTFDFSEQTDACSSQARAEKVDPKSRHLTFAGFSPDEQKQAIEQFEKAGMEFDPKTNILRPKTL